MKRARAWRCGNCGHEIQIPDDGSIGELKFAWLGPLASRTSCPNCGSCTIQRAYDDSFTAGEFLIIRTYNKIPKGRRNNGNT